MKHVLMLSLLIVAAMLLPITGIAPAHSQSNEPYIQLPVKADFVCYPWLIADHYMYSLASNKTVYIGTTPENVICTPSYIIVEGVDTTLVLNKTGGVVDTVVAPAFYVDTQAVAVYDFEKHILYIHKILGSDYSLRIPDIANATILPRQGTILDGIPVAVYRVSTNTSTQVYVETPSKTIVFSGADALIEGGKLYLLSGTTIYVYAISPDKLHTAPIDEIPVGTADYIIGYKNNTLYVRAGSYILAVDTIFHTYRVFTGVMTPIGVYTPEDTTYIDGKYPVPGYAIGKIGGIIVSNMKDSQNTTRTYLIPTNPVLLDVKSEFIGYITTGDGQIYVDLKPGIYTLPKNTVLVSVAGVHLKLVNNYNTYPPPQTPEYAEAPVMAEYSTIYPRHYYVSNKIPFTDKIYAGYGKLLLIRDTDAVVLGSKNAETIPGHYLFGGLSEHYAALYDGNTLTIYNISSGKPVKAYDLAGFDPELADIVRIDEKTLSVHIYDIDSMTEYTVSDTGITRRKVQSITVNDGSPVTLVYAENTSRIIYGDRQIILPGRPIYNGYIVTDTVGDKLKIYDFRTGTIYTVLGIPQNTTFYPLQDYLVAYNRVNRAAYIIPYHSWFSKTGVYVLTYPDAQVYVNGELIGNGSQIYLAPPGVVLHIQARKPYYRPAEATVTVTDKLQTVKLYPEPLIAKVRLQIISPANLAIDKISVKINGKETTWRNGEVKELLATKPYTIEIMKYYPVNVCEKQVIKETFPTGESTLTVRCTLTKSVLALYSTTTDATVLVYSKRSYPRQPDYVATVKTNKTAYLVVAPGEYIIVSKPTNTEWFRPVKTNATVAMNEIVSVDASPQPLGRLNITVTPSIATIRVLDKTMTKTLFDGHGHVLLNLTPGTYVVEASAPGFAAESYEVEVKPLNTTSLEITLHPAVQATTTTQTQTPVWRRVEFNAAVALVIITFAAVVLMLRRRRMLKVVEEEEEEEGGETK